VNVGDLLGTLVGVFVPLVVAWTGGLTRRSVTGSCAMAS
jgi:hypothetical protein